MAKWIHGVRGYIQIRSNQSAGFMVAINRDLPQVMGSGERHAAARIELAEQYVGDRLPSSLTREKRVENGSRASVMLRDGEWPAAL